MLWPWLRPNPPEGRPAAEDLFTPCCGLLEILFISSICLRARAFSILCSLRNSLSWRKSGIWRCWKAGTPAAFSTG